jgi:hypothetical protein
LANRGRPRKNIEINEIEDATNNNNENKNINANLIESQPSSNRKDREILAAFASVNDIQQKYFNLTNPNGVKTFADLIVPTDYNEQIKKAKELRDSDIIDRLLRIRQDYFARIKGFKCKNKSQQKFYNENVLPLVKRFAIQWEYEFYSVSEVFAHYGFKQDKRTPMFLRCENSESINPIEAFGFEAYEIKISHKLKEQIKKLQEKKMIDKLPDYLRKAINDKGLINDKITLDKENMHRSCNQKPDYETRPKPNLLRIMKSIALREFLIDLDFVNAYAGQKTSIIHSKGGTDIKPWSPEKVKDLHKLVTERAPGACFITTAGDCEISKVDINLNELLDPKKFEECNKRILDFFGIPIVFVPTQAGVANNQSVVVSLKSFEESIKSDRKIFQEFIDVFCEQINERNGYTKLPILEYELTNIRDDKNFLAELNFLFEKGVISFYDLCPIFNYDIDEQLESKKKALENIKLVSPYFENSQGLLSPIDPVEVNQNNNVNDVSNDITKK